MVVAQIGRFRVQELFDFFRQRVNGAARRKPHINLIFFLLRHTADLQRLAFVLSSEDLNRFADLNLLIFFLLLIK